MTSDNGSEKLNLNFFKKVGTLTEIPSIELRGVTKSFGQQQVIKKLDLKIAAQKTTALIGASGCGKTTCLRLMNGLTFPNHGEVWIEGKLFDYSKAVETRRGMGYCLQGYTLFPHMNVYENISIIAQKSGWSGKKIRTRAEEVLQLVHLPPEENLLKKPNQLSGGQRQRVGLARALFMNPHILLMDEPFGALDPITRGEIQESVLELQSQLKLTLVLVTHDLGEAFKMAHELVLLESGRIAQMGAPNRLLTHPASLYVEDFLKTNSPAHVLKSISLYSLMDEDIFVITKKLQDSVELKNLSSSERKTFESEEECKNFLRQRHQGLMIHVTPAGELLSFSSLDPSKTSSGTMALSSTMDLLEGLNRLLAQNFEALPVLDRQNKVRGIFSRKSLSLLDKK